MRPPALRRGDAVVVIAPSSPFDRERFDRGIRTLLGLGLDPRYGEDVFAHHVSYLAGDDARRTEELLRAVDDAAARAILLARGGYGLQRIVAKLAPERVAKNPKLLVGYSDGTVLHEVWRRAGVPSIHGPMCAQLGEDASATKRLAAIFGGEDPGKLHWPPHGARGGRIEAPLRGGNLAVLASLCGTPLQPQLGGSIVLLEDLNEPPYRLDRVCTQLLQSGVFDGVKGFLVGDLFGIGEPSEGRNEVLAERLGTLGVPMVFGAPFGHAGRNQPVAFGVAHALDPAEGSLAQLESAVEKAPPSV
jgi:muramoyltetrapeptide carboxypeptidase